MSESLLGLPPRSLLPTFALLASHLLCCSVCFPQTLTNLASSGSKGLLILLSELPDSRALAGFPQTVGLGKGSLPWAMSVERIHGGCKEGS